MPVNPPTPWSSSVPIQPVNWNRMSASEIKDKIDEIEKREAGINDELARNREKIACCKKRDALNKKVFFGGLATFAGGSVARMFVSSPVMIAVAAIGAATYISALIFQHLNSNKISDMGFQNDELRHQIDLSEIWHKAARENYDARLKEDEKRAAAAREEFKEMAAGLETGGEDPEGIIKEEDFIKIQGMKLEKHPHPPGQGGSPG